MAKTRSIPQDIAKAAADPRVRSIPRDIYDAGKELVKKRVKKRGSKSR